MGGRSAVGSFSTALGYRVARGGGEPFRPVTSCGGGGFLSFCCRFVLRSGRNFNQILLFSLP